MRVRAISDSKPEIRAAIIGAGLMGRWHAYSLTRAGGRLIAVVDSRGEASTRLAREYHTRAFSSLDELLAQVKVDVLHICTPLETHVEFATRALNANAHVLVEKPFAPDADHTQQLLELAQQRTRFIAPVHQFIFQRGVVRARERLPVLAPLVHMEMQVVSAGGVNGDAKQRDQLVADILPHALSLFNRFLPRCLDTARWLVQHPAPGELRAMGEMGHLSMGINISTAGRPTRNTFTLLGERGSAYMDLFHGFVVFEDDLTSRLQKISRPFKLAYRTGTAAAANLASRAWHGEVAYPGLHELIRAFYSALRTGAPMPILPQDILTIARTRDHLISESGLSPHPHD